jgi:hypothetical protein
VAFSAICKDFTGRQQSVVVPFYVTKDPDFRALQRNTNIDFIQSLAQTARIAEKSTPHGAHKAGHSPPHWL